MKKILLISSLAVILMISLMAVQTASAASDASYRTFACNDRAVVSGMDCSDGYDAFGPKNSCTKAIAGACPAGTTFNCVSSTCDTPPAPPPPGKEYTPSCPPGFSVGTFGYSLLIWGVGGADNKAHAAQCLMNSATKALEYILFPIAFGADGSISNVSSITYNGNTGTTSTGNLMQTGVFGRFVGFGQVAAKTTFTGLQMGAASPANGYALANAKCNNYPGSHICSPREMVFSYSEMTTPPAASTPSAWLNSGATAYVKYVSNDCNGWTAGDNQNFAYTWNFSKKQGFMSSCDQAMRVACCVY